MNWSDIAATVGKIAPAIGGVLAGPAGAAAGTLLASVLGTDDAPAAVAAAIQADPEAAVKIQKAELDHATEMRRLLLESQTRKQAEVTQRLAQVNKTMRAELAADGAFKSGWRPAVGWVMALSFAMIAGALCWSLVRDPSSLPDVIDAVIALIVAMGAVVGVGIKKRSDDKQTAMTGQPPAGLLSALRRK